MSQTSTPFDLKTLPWLPDAPQDFRARCKAIDATANDVGTQLQALAVHRVAPAQASAFGKALARCRGDGRTLSPLSPFRLAILASATFDLVNDFLPVCCARHGVALELLVADHDQIAQTALNHKSIIATSRPDGILLAFDHRWIGIEQFEPEQGAAEQVGRALAQLEMVLNGLAAQSGAQVIVTTLATPPGALFGSFESRVNNSVGEMIRAFNAVLINLARERGFALLDVARLAEEVGTVNWFDPVWWNLYKMPVANQCVPLFADTIARLIGAIRGKARKCLVLDLDNTLWGGVIGDDGLAGLKLGVGTAEGESFVSVQQLASQLKRRGVILAVCSKNFDETARRPFREHPDMVLREEDIAVFQANWSDKPLNVEAIARSLAIGLDSIVFLDDNSAERAQMRAALPMVAVPELPVDPALYALTLASAGYFEALSFSDEDRKRTDSYAFNAQRAEIESRALNLEDYLSALEMRITISPFDTTGRARIAQLINKSNQFNLTTRRYTEAEVEAVETDGNCCTLQVRLADKLSDYGMIGVVIARQTGHGGRTLDVDTWLMSCRVLGRKVEWAMLDALVIAAQKMGVDTICAHYFPTAKNGMVADLFDTLGMQRTGEDLDGNRDYRLDISGFVRPDLPFPTRHKA